jgi:hypothetical protein
MSISDWIKSFLGTRAATPVDQRRLGAVSEATLSSSLTNLATGEVGWITLQEARDLFSSMDDQYSFGEMDDQGKSNLAAFATEHRSSFDIMPIEGRIYFTRIKLAVDPSRPWIARMTCERRPGLSTRPASRTIMRNFV